MSTITYGDGTKINFNGSPTQQDIEEAYSQVKGSTGSGSVLPSNQGIPSSAQSPTNVQGSSIASSLGDLAGVTSLGKGTAQVLANSELGGQNQANIDKETQSNNSIMDLVNKIRAANPLANRPQSVKDKLTALINQVNNPYQNNNLENTASNGEGYVTPGQVVGSAIQTAGNILSAGTLSKVAPSFALAGKAAEVAPAATGFGSKLAAFLGRTGYNAALAGANNVGAGLQNKTIANAGDALNAAKTGAELGGALSAGGEAVAQTAKGAGWLTRNVLGGTTGKGANAIQELAANPTKDAIAALRGKTGAEDVLTTARDAVSQIKNAQQSEYTSAMEKAGQNAAPITKDSIKSILGDTLGSYGLSVGNDGQLVSSAKSNIPASALGEVQKAVDEVNAHVNSGDTSLAAADALKQRVSDLVKYDASQTTKTQGILRQLSGSIGNHLKETVPGYEAAVKPYADTQNLLKEINSALGTGNNTSKQTAIQKLGTALKNNQPFRQQMVETLDTATGSNLKGKIAGATMSPVMPGALQTAGDTGIGLAAAGHIISAPAAAAAAALTSPRLVGEGAVKYGQLSKVAGTVAPKSLRNVLTRQAIMRLSQTNNK